MAFGFIFDDDIFISYSRADGSTYANGLADALLKKGFTCFLDRMGTEANPTPPETLFQKIRSSKMLILLGSEGAINSKHVADEVAAFVSAHQGTSRIIPISFDRGAPDVDWSQANWYNNVVGLAREREPLEALTTGDVSLSEESEADKDAKTSGDVEPGEAALADRVSEGVIKRVEKQFQYTTSKERLRKYRNRAAAAFLIILALGLLASVYAYRQSASAVEAGKAAKKANDEAMLAQARAAEANQSAVEARANADQVIADANLKIKQAQEALTRAQGMTEDANRKRLLADSQRRNAEALRDVAELQEQRSSLVAQARDALDSRDPLKSYELSRQSLELEARQPKIGQSSSARLVYAQAIQRGVPASYPYFKDISHVTINPQGTYIAAIGDDSQDEEKKLLRVWPVNDPQQQHSMPSTFGDVAFTPDGDSIVVSKTTEVRRIPSDDPSDDAIENKTEIYWYSLDLKFIKKLEFPLFKTQSPDGRKLVCQVDSIEAIEFTADKRRMVLSGEASPSISSPERGGYYYHAWVDLSDFKITGRLDLIPDRDGPVVPPKPGAVLDTSAYLLSATGKIETFTSGGDTAQQVVLKKVTLDDMESGKRIPVGEHPVAITALAASPSGKTIAVVGQSNQVSIFSEAEGAWKASTRTLPGKAGASQVVFTAEDQLAIARDDFTIVLLPVNEKSTPLANPTPSEDEASTTTAATEDENPKPTDENPEPTPPAAAGADNLESSPVDSDEVDFTNSPFVILRVHTDGINELQVSPDGRWLATASQDKTVRVWNLYGDDPGELQGNDAAVYHLKFSGDGHSLVSAGDDGVIRLWRVEDGFHAILPADPDKKLRERQMSRLLWTTIGGEVTNLRIKASAGLADYVVWSPDGNYLASTNYDGKATLWTKDYRLLKTFDSKGYTNHPVSFSSDSRWLYTISFGPEEQGVTNFAKNLLDLWEVNGERHFSISINTGADAGLFSRNGEWAEVDLNGGLTLHRIEDGIDGAKLTPGVFSPNGKWFVVRGEEGIRLWRLDGARSRAVSLKISGADPSSVIEFARNADFLLVGRNESKVFDLESLYKKALEMPDRRLDEKLLNQYLTKIDSMPGNSAIAFSPDGKWVATTSGGGYDGTIYLWPVHGGEPKVLRGHRDYVTSAAFSPDSKWLATGSIDRTVRLWSLEANQVQSIRVLNPIDSVSFSPAGTRLAAATGPAIKIWFSAIGQAGALLDETANTLGSHRAQ